MFATAVITVQGQTISNVTVLPSNPTSEDPITVITQSTFNNSAYTVTNNLYVDTVNFVINIQLFKCQTTLTVITTITDTFQVGLLPEGTYALNIMLFSAQYNATTGVCEAFAMVDTDNSSIVISAPGPPTAIKENIGLRQVMMKPNPASSYFNITGLTAGAQVQIANITGKVVKTLNVDPAHGNPSVEVSDLPAGIYICTIASGNKSISKRLVITR